MKTEAFTTWLKVVGTCSAVLTLRWLRGKDLNPRPLGYEFNSWFWMDSVIAKNQSHTVSMWWLISIVPGCLVSNLLALFGLRPTRLANPRSHPTELRSQKHWNRRPGSNRHFFVRTEVFYPLNGARIAGVTG